MKKYIDVKGIVTFLVGGKKIQLSFLLCQELLKLSFVFLQVP